MSRRTILNWSSGKDSAWALHLLQHKKDIDLVGLVTTVNQTYQRVTMHAVRMDLLEKQAKAIGLPLDVLSIPHPCSNEEYQAVMQKCINKVEAENIECMAFGDLYLQDVREYRKKNLKHTRITPLFPLWGIPTTQLANEMVSNGLRAFITCVDPTFLPSSFAGREFDQSFLTDLPEGIDPCGENGEFHTFVVDGPQFNESLNVKVGEIVKRDGFVFADVLPNNLEQE